MACCSGHCHCDHETNPQEIIHTIVATLTKRAVISNRHDEVDVSDAPEIIQKFQAALTTSTEAFKTFLNDAATIKELVTAVTDLPEVPETAFQLEAEFVEFVSAILEASDEDLAESDDESEDEDEALDQAVYRCVLAIRKGITLEEMTENLGFMEAADVEAFYTAVKAGVSEATKAAIRAFYMKLDAVTREEDEEDEEEDDDEPASESDLESEHIEMFMTGDIEECEQMLEDEDEDDNEEIMRFLSLLFLKGRYIANSKGMTGEEADEFAAQLVGKMTPMQVPTQLLTMLGDMIAAEFPTLDAVEEALNNMADEEDEEESSEEEEVEEKGFGNAAPKTDGGFTFGN